MLWSGKIIVKKSVSLHSLLLMFVILQPLFLLSKTSMPLFLVGQPWKVYLENRVRCLFFRDFSFDSQIWESITMLISLFRSKKVCNLANSFFVPILEPLRFVEVIVILLEDFGLYGLILKLVRRKWKGPTLNEHWLIEKTWRI